MLLIHVATGRTAAISVPRIVTVFASFHHGCLPAALFRILDSSSLSLESNCKEASKAFMRSCNRFCSSDIAEHYCPFAVLVKNFQYNLSQEIHWLLNGACTHVNIRHIKLTTGTI